MNRLKTRVRAAAVRRVKKTWDTITALGILALYALPVIALLALLAGGVAIHDHFFPKPVEHTLCNNPTQAMIDDAIKFQSEHPDAMGIGEVCGEGP